MVSPIPLVIAFAFASNPQSARLFCYAGICELAHGHRVNLASLQVRWGDRLRVPLEYERKGGNDVRVLTHLFLPSSATASSPLHQ